MFKLDNDKKPNDKDSCSVVVTPLQSCQEELLEETRDVFVVQEDGPDFRGVSCIGAAILIGKTQFGIGVLGIPATFSTLGFVPGLIVLTAFCILSTWAGYIVGKFRTRHPWVFSVGDAAEVLFGKIGKEVVGAGFCFYYCLVYSAALIAVSIGLNTLSGHSLCTTVFVAIAAIITFILGVFVRTMKIMSWLGYGALTTVFVSAWIVSIACLAQSRPAAAPANEPVDKQIAAFFVGKSFASIGNAIGVQLMGVCGTAAYFNIHSEMRDQTQYNKSLVMGSSFVLVNYILIACLIYGKVGIYVTSPALGSAGLLFKKICYGIALPGLIYTCFFHAHLAAKYGFVRILRNTKHLQSNTMVHWGTWTSLILGIAIFGFIIASAIPFFDNLLALVASLIGTSFVLIIPGCMALHMLGGYEKSDGDGRFAWVTECWKYWAKSKRTKLTTYTALLCIAFGLFIFGAGTYGAVQSIIDNYEDGSVSLAFNCADNS